MRRRTTERRTRLPLAALSILTVLLLAATGACAPDTTDQMVEEEQEAVAETEAATEEAEVVEKGAGGFELILAGDVEATREGTASCVLETTTGELRATLDPVGPSDYRYHLVVPGYDVETGKYEGEIQLSGADRAVGPIEVAITRVEGDGMFEPQLTIAFEGTYAGAAGVGTAEGEAICSLPSGGEPMAGADPEVEEET